MITAAEARELAGPTAEEYLKEIEVFIRDAAIKKQRSVTIRKHPYAGWLYDEKGMAPEAKIAIQKLKDAGYSVSPHYVSPHYVEELQFAERGLEISW